MKKIYILFILILLCISLKSQDSVRQIDSLYRIAVQLYINEQYDSSLAIVNKLIKIDTNNCSIYELKGDIYTGFDEYDQAEKEYFKSIEKGCDKVNIFLSLKILYFVQGKYNKSLCFMNRAIKLKPDSGYLYFKRSSIKMLLGDQTGMKSDLQIAKEKGYEQAGIMLKAIEEIDKEQE